MPNRNPELNRNRGAARANGHARKTRLAIAMVVVTSLSLTAILISPISFSSHGPEKAVPANPLGIMGDVSWTNMSPSSPPTARALCAFVYDPPTDTFVLFGGVDQDFNMLDDTWSYDLGANSWQELFPADHPVAALWTTYTYDTVDNLMLLFGTSDGSFIPANETWSYNASTNVWNNLYPTNSPPIRTFSSMAYDSRSDKMVLFGGEGVDGVLNDTWSYDFTSNAWTYLTPVNSPFPRKGAVMVYDSESDRIILFGGLYSDPTGAYEFLLADTWSYDIDSNTWTNMTPALNPIERTYASAVYDSLSDVMLIFGGVSPTDEAFDDLWAYDYDANSWWEVSQLTRPPGRAYGSMAINPSTSEVVLFSGMNIMGFLGDTWSAQLGAVIPEFSTLITPIVGMLALFAVVSMKRKRDDAN